MFTVNGPSDQPCFITGTRDKCVQVKFKDGSFQGSIAWEALWKIFERQQKPQPKPLQPPMAKSA